MSDERVFLDTNILVYAYDRSAGDKHDRAKELVLGLRRRPTVPAISVQVLQELFVNLVRKGVSAEEAGEVVGLHLAWKVVVNDVEVFRAGLEAQRRWQLSPWDAWIVAAAQRAGAGELWTEDLNADQDYGGVRTVNPFE